MRTVQPGGTGLLALLDKARNHKVIVVAHIVDSNATIVNDPPAFANKLFTKYTWVVPPPRNKNGEAISAIFPGECNLMGQPGRSDHFVANLCAMVKLGTPSHGDSKKLRIQRFMTSLDSFLHQLQKTDVDLACTHWTLAVPYGIGCGDQCTAKEFAPYRRVLKQFEIDADAVLTKFSFEIKLHKVDTQIDSMYTGDTIVLNLVSSYR